MAHSSSSHRYGSPIRGRTLLSTVSWVAWAASLATCFTLWTLAPRLTSGQTQIAADQPCDGGLVHMHALLQTNRRMQQVPAAFGLGSQAADVPGHSNSSAAPEPTPQQLVPQQQQLQRPQAPQKAVVDPVHGLPVDLVKQIGPVDVVYLWVNGSDPVLAQELQDLHDHPPPLHAGTASVATKGNSSSRAPPQSVDNPARRSRFDAGCDELRYSLRSVERYMPWFRHIYIVTNGQVPSWLATTNDRATIVPHSSIFERAADLPTFNSVAIQANIANIPGLSDTFIMMDDDFFLIKPWTLSDFITPDGGQTLTGSTLTTKINPKGNLYLQMSLNTAAIFERKFGTHPRHDPAHAPRLLQKRYLQELQQKLPEEFEATSASQLRSPSDIMIPSAYMWYISQFQPGSHPTVPDARTSFVSTNKETGRDYMRAAFNDFQARVIASDPHVAAYAAAQNKAPKLLSLQQTTDFEARLPQHGPAVLGYQQVHLLYLVRAWLQPGAKMVCLNDDVEESMVGVRPLFQPVIQSFLAKRYSTPSTFELPMGHTNGCNGHLPGVPFGTLPGPRELQQLCGPHRGPAPQHSSSSQQQQQLLAWHLSHLLSAKGPSAL